MITGAHFTQTDERLLDYAPRSPSLDLRTTSPALPVERRSQQVIAPVYLHFFSAALPKGKRAPSFLSLAKSTVKEAFFFEPSR